MDSNFKIQKSASYKRILSWFAFEWHLYFLDRRRLERPDVVIISSLSLLTILYGVFLKRLYGCKLVFEVRDIYPLTLTEELGISACNPLVLLLKFVEKLGYRRADLIVGTMPNLRSHVQKVLGYTKDVFFLRWVFEKSGQTRLSRLRKSTNCFQAMVV